MRSVATHLAAWEPILVGIAAPFLLFPRGWLPWVGVSLLCLGWAARWLSSGHITRSTRLDVPVLLLLCMAGVGVAISVLPSVSWNRFWSLFYGVAVFYSLVNWAISEQQAVRAASTLAGLSLLAAVISLVGTDWSQTRLLDLPWLYQHLPTLIRGIPGSGVSASELFNPRWVGITFGFLAPLFMAFFLFASDRRLKILSGCALGTALLLVLLSQSIQGLVAILVGSLVVAVWRSRWWLMAIPLGVFLVAILVNRVGDDSLARMLLSLEHPLGAAVVLRLDMWSRGLAMLNDLPYTGIGLNTFPYIQAHFYPGYSIGLEPHAHNLYLQTALDMGLPGLAAFVWIMIAWFVGLRRNYLRATMPDYRLLLVGLTAGFAGYLAHGFMDALMLGAKPGVALWFVLGLGAAEPFLQPAAVGQTFRHRWHWAIPTALLIAGLIITITKPVSWQMNLAALQAHRLLYPLEVGESQDTSGLDQAAIALDGVIQRDPLRLMAYELRARVAAWLGDPATAVAMLSHRIRLDGLGDPLSRYHPAGALQERFANQTVPDDTAWEVLQQVYRQWVIRYPQQAINHVRLILLLNGPLGKPTEAAGAWQTALAQGARPPGLLDYLLDK